MGCNRGEERKKMQGVDLLISIDSRFPRVDRLPQLLPQTVGYSRCGLDFPVALTGLFRCLAVIPVPSLLGLAVACWRQ